MRYEKLSKKEKRTKNFFDDCGGEFNPHYYKIKSIKVVNEGDTGESITMQQLVETSKDYSSERLEGIFCDLLERGPCGHEHDCCGCWNTRVYGVRKIKKNKFIVEISSYMNI